MSKNPQPTVEELRFIYDLISKGYDDKSILEEYTLLDRQGVRIYPTREDKRFIAKRRLEYEACQDILLKRLQTKANPIISENIGKHYKDLLKVAEVIIEDVKDYARVGNYMYKYYPDYYREGEDEESIKPSIHRSGLIEMLQDGVVFASRYFGRKGLFEPFISHIKEEDPAYSDIYKLVEEDPDKLIKFLKMLLLRRTFKGKCEICKDF